MFVPRQQNVTKKYRLFILVVLATFFLLCKQYGCNKPESSESVVIDAKGRVSQPLLDLLKLLKVSHDGTINDIVAKTQKLWIRPAGSELWHVKDIYHEQALEIIPIFKKIGCVDAVYPTKREYHYLLFLGASLPSLRKRLASIIQWWKDGIRFKEIVFLTGQRILDPELESESALLNSENAILANRPGWQAPENLPIMEVDMMKMVYDQVDLPQAMRDQAAIIIIDSPQRTLPNGKKGRPITDDTIVSWLATNPTPGSCLAVSNQPHLWRQHAVLKHLLPKSFIVESAGSGIALEKINCTSFLDTIARWLYQENEYTKKVIKK